MTQGYTTGGMPGAGQPDPQGRSAGPGSGEVPSWVTEGRASAGLPPRPYGGSDPYGSADPYGAQDPLYGGGEPSYGTGAPYGSTGAPYGSTGAPYGTADAPYGTQTQPVVPHQAGPTQPTADEKPESASSTPAAAAPKKPGRDRYLDLLRSIALVRVVVYHLFGWAWLSVLFPSMGVMFALAGSLMARSLSRPAFGVIRGRIRRLLPPLWAFSIVALTMMFWGGWDPAKDPNLGGSWGLIELVNYIIPIGAPPYPWHVGSDSGLLEPTWAVQAAGVLWYLRAYLWFVIASPLLLWAFRKAPWVTMLAPLALTAVVGTGLVKIPGETGNAVTDFAVYGGCWVLGMAHQEGVLQKVPRYVAVSCSALIMAFGLWWASGHLGPDGWDLNDIPLAQATWSFGFVVILLQYSPSWQELPGKLAKWDKLVTLSNNRAVTIYLWHNLLIMATVPIIDKMYNLPFMDDRLSHALDTTYMLWMFVLVWPLIALAIVTFGWIEDFAAKRSPRMWPNGAKKKSAQKGARGR